MWSIRQVFNTRILSTGTKDQIKKQIILNESDIVEKFIIGSGNGGQAMQKTANCVQLHHIPSGIIIKCHDTRSREQNRKIARKRLIEKLDVIENGKLSKLAQEIYKEQKRKQKYAKRAQLKHGGPVVNSERRRDVELDQDILMHLEDLNRNDDIKHDINTKDLENEQKE